MSVNDKFKRFGNIGRDMDANQDDSMEDCLGEETLGESHDWTVTPQVFSSIITLHLHEHKQASFISCISL
jgi:hypothetical protein